MSLAPPNIMAKLGVSSRTEAAAVAHRTGLAGQPEGLGRRYPRCGEVLTAAYVTSGGEPAGAGTRVNGW